VVSHMCSGSDTNSTLLFFPCSQGKVFNASLIMESESGSSHPAS